MFSVSLHVEGRPVSVDTPVAAGPRHCGQSSAEAGAVQMAPAATRAGSVETLSMTASPAALAYSIYRRMDASCCR
jgi:hypothetical protein